MKIGVFIPNWIGDVVMATPALRAIRTKFPDAAVIGIMRPYVADVLDGTDLIDRSIFHNPRGNNKQHKGLSFISALRREQFDTVVLLPNSVRSGWNARLSGAKRRIGFARDGRKWLLTDAVKPRPKSEPYPVLDSYLELVAKLGCDISNRETELAVSDADIDMWNDFVSRQHVNWQARDIVCINPGGAFGAAKHWPAKHFGQLAKRLATARDVAVAVLCGPNERDEARDIVREANHPLVVHLADEQPSLGLTKAAIGSSQLLVTTDSGPRHFAQPFNVPVVTLFGPTHIAWSETHYNRGVHLQIPVDCGPCQQRTCPLSHHRCMVDLTVEQVFNAAIGLMTDERSAAA